jgi:hypothetical protein
MIQDDFEKFTAVCKYGPNLFSLRHVIKDYDKIFHNPTHAIDMCHEIATVAQYWVVFDRGSQTYKTDQIDVFKNRENCGFLGKLKIVDQYM